MFESSKKAMELLEKTQLHFSHSVMVVATPHYCGKMGKA